MLPAVLSLETLLNMSEVADLKYAGFYPMMPMPVPYPFNPVLGPRQHLPAFVSPKMPSSPVKTPPVVRSPIPIGAISPNNKRGRSPVGSWERQQSWGQSVYSGISDIALGHPHLPDPSHPRGRVCRSTPPLHTAHGDPSHQHSFRDQRYPTLYHGWVTQVFLMDLS